MYLYYVLFLNILYRILIHQNQMINNQGLIQKLEYYFQLYIQITHLKGMMVHKEYKSQLQYYDVDQ
ncbi:unnamed protein product [Paramecium pentaurelia]|uniref:Uncharacterized protein n=1 Tax=Paramecium pentaurelia TaxID=43138 RepID=A0A8S1VTC7_9CILI|nr:unnamed protein product [Paramecium pentaurelia]CAD8180640.1 unnamed protein product [Paramecium pentaurelia]